MSTASSLPKEGTEWPNLLGKTSEEARMFLQTTYGSKLEIVVVPEGSMVTMDHRLDRVRLFVDEKTETVIVGVPRVG